MRMWKHEAPIWKREAGNGAWRPRPTDRSPALGCVSLSPLSFESCRTRAAASSDLKRRREQTGQARKRPGSPCGPSPLVTLTSNRGTQLPIPASLIPNAVSARKRCGRSVESEASLSPIGRMVVLLSAMLAGHLASVCAGLPAPVRLLTYRVSYAAPGGQLCLHCTFSQPRAHLTGPSVVCARVCMRYASYRLWVWWCVVGEGRLLRPDCKRTDKT